MPDIKAKIEDFNKQLPSGTRLVAVSKFHPVEELQEAYDAGQRRFGESRAQEFVVKAPQLPQDICWHFIGHLQKNNVRAIVDDRNEKIGKKIRDNELKRIPYLLIVGEKEAAAEEVSVRKQGEGDQGSKKIITFAADINAEVAQMTKF